MSLNNLSRHVVKIECRKNDGGENNIGSGVVLPSSEEYEYLYVLTCMHVLNNISDVENVYLYLYDNDFSIFEVKPNELVLIPLTEANEVEADGICVLIVNKISINSDSFIKSIASLFLSNVDFDSCWILGYPAMEQHNSGIEYFQCTYNVDLSNNKYEVYSERPVTVYGKDENTSLQGLSGSGVFCVNSANEYTLVGIQIQNKGPRDLICFDLRKVLGEINSKLKTSGFYEISQHNFLSFEGLSIKSEDLNFSRIESHLGDSCITDIKDIKSFRKDVDVNIKRLADSYLNLGIKYHKSNDNWQATYYLSQAIKYCPSHRIYLLHAKDIRTKKENECLKNTVDENVHIPDEEKIASLKSVISENYNKEDNLESFVENYLSLVNFYKKDVSKHEDELRAIYISLAEIYLNDYEACRKYVQLMLDLPSSSTNKAIKLKGYELLLKSSSISRKYEEGLDFCNEIIKLRLSVSSKILVYIEMMKMNYFLERKGDVLFSYQKANELIPLLDPEIDTYKSLSIKLRRTWNMVSHKFVNDSTSFENEISSFNESFDMLKNEIGPLNDRVNLIKNEIESIRNLMTVSKDLENIPAPSFSDIYRKFKLKIYKWLS